MKKITKGLLIFLIGASLSLVASPAKKGKKLFRKKFCVNCHATSPAKKAKLAKDGPYLVGITKVRSEKWLDKYLQDPVKVSKSDKRLKKIIKNFKEAMEKPDLSEKQRKLIIEYLKTL